MSAPESREPAPARYRGRPGITREGNHQSTCPTRSAQVNWSECVAYLDRVAADRDLSLWPGTPQWCELRDADPRKLLALAEFGLHHALRVEVAQQQLADAGRAVAAAAGWSEIANAICRRQSGNAYVRRAAS